jgi:hypothetical protein
MKNSSPDEIGAVVGMVPDVKCTLALLLIEHVICFLSVRLYFEVYGTVTKANERYVDCILNVVLTHFIIFITFGLCSSCIRFLGECSRKILK